MKDWPRDTNPEVMNYVIDNGIILGYPDGTFRPWDIITAPQVARMANRAGIRTDIQDENFDYYPVTMKWIEENFLPGTVFSAEPWEFCTRYRAAIMFFRFGKKPGPSTIPAPDIWGITAFNLNKWFDSTYYKWQGVKRQTRFVGLGTTFVEQSMSHRVPLWLSLGQAWRESCWATTGLSINYNMPWGIKATPAKWGEIKGYVGEGFGDYVTIEESVKAYFRYMDQSLYRTRIDNHQWRSILDTYAPPYENNSSQHYAIVMKVKSWCEERGISQIDRDRNLW